MFNTELSVIVYIGTGIPKSIILPIKAFSKGLF